MDRGVKLGAWWLAGVLAATGATAPELRAAPAHREGETVAVTGRVTDPAGEPLPGVTVLLEASRTAFRLRGFRREKSNTLTIPTTAGDDGSFRFDWRWDPFYNTFELAVGMPVRRGGEDAYEILHRQEITGVMEAGDVVTVDLEVADTGYLEWLRRFLDGRASEDELRIFREMGRPDRVDREERRGAVEGAWWYFEAGKVYRFRGGELDQVIHFEPVKPL